MAKKNITSLNKIKKKKVLKEACVTKECAPIKPSELILETQALDTIISLLKLIKKEMFLPNFKNKIIELKSLKRIRVVYNG